MGFSICMSELLVPNLRYDEVRVLGSLSAESFNASKYEGLFFKQKLNHSQIDSETWDQV